MDTPFAGGTDPTPYIAAAYAIGLIGICGFYLWAVAERKKLRQLLVAVRNK